MKNMNKIILMTSAMLMAGTAWADDFGDFNDFGTFDNSDSAASKLEVNGCAALDVRSYVDLSEIKDASAKDVEMAANPSAKINMKYNGSKSDVSLSLKVDEDTIKNNPQDVIDEAVLRGYFGDFTLEAGKMKVVWGKGDKLHVLDNFNADDYSDFIIPDYIDRRISTPMIRGVYSLPFANMNIEGIYTPFLPVDRFATSGRWTPAQVNTLKSAATSSAEAYLKKLVTDCETYRTGLAAASVMAASAQSPAVASAAAAQAEEYKLKLAAADAAYLFALNYVSSVSDDIYPDLMNLKYSQFGGRVTGTFGRVDLGLSYYNGWYKQPVFNAAKLNGFISSYLADGKVSENEKFLAYDKKQTFGLEAATTLWHFNLRTEAAYNLTDDVDGTDPWVHNNSVAWLGGFDIDLPFWNANLNVQETGTFVLQGSECDKNKLDADYAVNGYTNNKIVANFSSSFVNEKIAPEVTVMYGIENRDLVILPKISYKPDQNLTLTASGMYIWCGRDSSEFKSWENNSFVSLGVSYQF